MADNNNISIKISAQDAASPVFQRFLAQLQGVKGKTDEVNKQMGASFGQMAGGVAQMGAAFSTLTSGGLSGMVSGFTTLNAGLKNVTTSFGELSKNAQIATTVVGGVVAVAAAIGGAMFGLAKKAADAGDEMYTLSGRLGISVEKLSTLSIIAGAAGASTADLTTGLKILSQRLSEAQDPASEAARIFKILGINTKQTVDEAFVSLGDALQKLPSEADKLTVFLALLGRGGQALLPMFEKGGRSITEYQKLLREMGLEMSGKTAEAGDRMNDAFQLMSVIFDAVVRKLGEGLVPKFAELAETLVKVFGNKQVMDGAMAFGRSLVWIFDSTVKVLGAMAALYGWTAKLFGLAEAAAQEHGTGAGLTTFSSHGVRATTMSSREARGSGGLFASHGPGATGGRSFEEQLAADKARAEAGKAAEEADQDRQKKFADLIADTERARRTNAFFSGVKSGSFGYGAGIGLGVGVAPTIGTDIMQRLSEETTLAKKLREQYEKLQAEKLRTFSTPEIAPWRKYTDGIINFFRGPGGIFPSISAGFQEFQRQSLTLSEVTTSATVNVLQNFQTGLAGAYQNLIFGGADEKARKRAIDALKDIRTEAASLALDVFGQSGELGTREVSIIDTLFGMADQQNLPEDTKNRIAQLKVQMLSIETPQQQTAFGESITSMIDQLEAQGGFLGRLKEFGKTMASNVSTSFQEGIAAMLAQATMDILGLGRGGYTITFVGNFIDNVSREISHIGGKAIDITANLIGDAWDKIGVLANVTGKAVTFSFNALMEGNARMWESIFKMGDWAAEGGKAVINVGGNMLESYTRVMDSLGNFADKTIRVTANVIRNPGDAWDKIQEFGSKLISVGSTVARSTGDAWEKIQEFGSKIVNVYSIAKERAGDAWDKIKEFGAKSFEVTANIAGIAWDRVREFSEKSFSVVATMAGDAWDKIKEFTPKDIKVLATAAGSAFERIGEFTQKTFNVIANVGNDPGEAWTRIREFTQKTFNVIANLAGDAWEKVKEFGPITKEFFVKAKKYADSGLADLWEGVKDFGGGTKEFFVKAKKYADSGLTDLWEGIKSFSGIKEFSVRAIKSGAGLADDAWEGISKIAGWVNDGIYITAALDNLADFGSRISDLFRDGQPVAVSIKDNLGAAVKNGFLAAGLASMFLPGGELGAGIGAALGTMIGSAFSSSQVGGAIGGLLGGIVDKLFFSSEREEGSEAYKNLLTDVQAFGGVKEAFAKSGTSASGLGRYFDVFRGGSGQRTEASTLFRVTGRIGKEAAEGAFDVIRGIMGGGQARIAASAIPETITFLQSIGFSEAIARRFIDATATEGTTRGQVEAPRAAQTDLDKAIEILNEAVRIRGLSKNKLSTTNWRIMSQAINAVGGIWPGLGVAVKDALIYGDNMQDNYRLALVQSGVPLIARYGLGRVPGAEGQPVPAIVHGGEQILSAPQARAGMGADSNVNLNTTIVVQDMGGGAQSARQTGDAIWRELEPRFEDFLRRKSRWGQLNYSERSLRTVLQ